MWLILSLASALFLGFYDFAKKESLRRNSVMWVLFSVTVLSTVFLIPFFKGGSTRDFLLLVPKAFVVTLSWVSGLQAMKLLPLTTASTIKASRPVLVVVMSIIIFGERLNLWQWAGVLTTVISLYTLSISSRKEGISFVSNRGVWWMILSVVSGAASALYDKYIMRQMDPLFVQCWSNLFISALMGIILAVKMLREEKGSRERFHWDWMIVVTAVLIVLADACYFFCLHQEDAMLSIVSLLRRCSVIVTFAMAAVVFKEKRIKEKALSLAIMFAGMFFLLYGSSI